MEQLDKNKGEHLAFLHAANLVRKYKADNKILLTAIIAENVFIIIIVLLLWLRCNYG